MKIVVLVGSPRKGGNTETLAQAFAQGASEHNDVEMIRVSDVCVNPCLGCNACRVRPNRDCFQKDDMSMIYERLASADMIAVASPVYFYGLSAQLKAIVDRLHAPVRKAFRVKKLALLMVAADVIQEVFDCVLTQYRLILNYFHLEDAGTVLVRGVEEKGAIQGHPVLGEAFTLGQSIC